MTRLIIQKVTKNDIYQLQEISRQTFHETFAAVNTEENMQQYHDEALSIEKLTDEFNDENVEFYFATIDDHVIGYLKINFGLAQTELKEDNAVEIERIYVLCAYHGKKIGQILFDKAVEIARNKNAEYIWLGVWEENIRAISFYEKNGFVEFDKHLFKLGDDVQTDIMMKLNLENNEQ